MGRTGMDAPMQKRTVALFVPTLGGGGAERVMITLAGEFVRAGCAVDLLTVDGAGPYRAELPAEVRVVDFATGRVSKSFGRLCRYLRQERPQVLMATLTHANVASVLARAVTGVQVRLFVREANVLSRETAGARLGVRVAPWLVRWTYRLADGIIAPSEGVADDLVKNHSMARKRVHVIHNPVVNDRLFTLAQQLPSHPWARDREIPLVLGVGRLTPQKDFATLIRAFRQVRERHVARLLILGEGEQRGMLERLVAELGLEEDVALPGFVENPFAYMTRASVFVLSSLFEGLPNAMVQAFALGTPIVATDCQSGPREILQGGRFGTLVPVGDETAMASAIVGQISGGREGAATKSASLRFHVRKVTEDYLALFGLAHG